jgi:anaerobic selenocysteine-containing dehydrogenase
MSDEATTHKAICRICINGCALDVTVDRGKVIDVTGDRDNPMFQGYTCVKGRAQPAFLNSPDRILRPLRREPDGSFTPIGYEQALDEIADRLRAIREARGPNAIAHYLGTFRDVVSQPMSDAFMDALGSPLRFDPNTIDKPGKLISMALHGAWMAPPMNFQDARVALVIGANPLVGHTGFPSTNPSKWVTTMQRQGMKLVVIDPRETDIAKRADLFIQPRPGFDDLIMAAMLKVIVEERLYDQEFVQENASGLARLTAELKEIALADVARIADVRTGDIAEAARIFAAAGRGFVFVGTGANMAQSGSFVEYLAMNLTTLCGYWLREGERVDSLPTLLPVRVPRAQAAPPKPVRSGLAFRSRGLTGTPAGLPTSAACDEILLPGDQQIRALIVNGGNPVVGWPDQLKVIEAMKALELLVCIDPWMTATTRYAHYVLPPIMPLETESSSQSLDMRAAFGMPGYGMTQAYAQYSPKIVDPPAGSDLMEDWEIYFELARRLGLGMKLHGQPGTAAQDHVFDMTRRPTPGEMIELMARGSRVPLAEVKRHPSGALFPEPAVHVQPKEPGWTGRFELANEEMMADLAALAREVRAPDAGAEPADLPYRLISRRMRHVFNSSGNMEPANRGKPFNPAFMHPADLEAEGLCAGDVIGIISARASVIGIVEPDKSLRRGLISMAHSFGGSPDEDDRFALLGAPTGRLIDQYAAYDRYSGQPRMSNIPVRIERLTQTGQGIETPRAAVMAAG